MENIKPDPALALAQGHCHPIRDIPTSKTLQMHHPTTMLPYLKFTDEILFFYYFSFYSIYPCKGNNNTRWNRKHKFYERIVNLICSKKAKLVGNIIDCHINHNFVYFESQYIIRNNVQAAMTAASMRVSLDRFLLIEPAIIRNNVYWKVILRKWT